VFTGGLDLKARIKWVEDRTFLAESGSGHGYLLGTSTGIDGSRISASAMEFLLMGTGGCAAWDVVDILEKGRQNIDNVEVELEAERSGELPKVFTKIHLHFVVTGHEVSSSKVERAIALSVEKYCSALAMMTKTAEATHDFEIKERIAPT
jgi:putative redox protein